MLRHKWKDQGVDRMMPPRNLPPGSGSQRPEQLPGAQPCLHAPQPSPRAHPAPLPVDSRSPEPGAELPTCRVNKCFLLPYGVCRKYALLKPVSNNPGE